MKYLLARVGAGFVTADCDGLEAPVSAAEREWGGKDGLDRWARVRGVVEFVLKRYENSKNRQKFSYRQCLDRETQILDVIQRTVWEHIEGFSKEQYKNTF